MEPAPVSAEVRCGDLRHLRRPGHPRARALRPVRPRSVPRAGGLHLRHRRERRHDPGVLLSGLGAEPAALGLPAAQRSDAGKPRAGHHGRDAPLRLTGSPLSTGNGGRPVQYPILLPTPLSAWFFDPTYVINPPRSRTPGATRSSPSAPATTLPGKLQHAGARRCASRTRIRRPSRGRTGPSPTRARCRPCRNIALDISTTDDYQTLTLASGPAEADASFESTHGAEPRLLLPGHRGLDPGSGARARGADRHERGQRCWLPASRCRGRSRRQPDARPVDLRLRRAHRRPSHPGRRPYWYATLGSAERLLGPAPGRRSRRQRPAPTPTIATRAAPASSAPTARTPRPTPTRRVADTVFARDLPILEAYDDHLVLGRFGWFRQDSEGRAVGEQPNNRVVVGPGPRATRPPCALVALLLPSPGDFKVRTGASGSRSGSATGLLHHVQADPATNRCVLSCNPTTCSRTRGRSTSRGRTPRRLHAARLRCPPASTATASSPCETPCSRSSPGAAAARPASNDHTNTARDIQWKFSSAAASRP